MNETIDGFPPDNLEHRKRVWRIACMGVNGFIGIIVTLLILHLFHSDLGDRARATTAIIFLICLATCALSIISLALVTFSHQLRLRADKSREEAP